MINQVHRGTKKAYLGSTHLPSGARLFKGLFCRFGTWMGVIYHKKFIRSNTGARLNVKSTPEVDCLPLPGEFRRRGGEADDAPGEGLRAPKISIRTCCTPVVSLKTCFTYLAPVVLDNTQLNAVHLINVLMGVHAVHLVEEISMQIFCNRIVGWAQDIVEEDGYGVVVKRWPGRIVVTFKLYNVFVTLELSEHSRIRTPNHTVSMSTLLLSI